MDALQDALRQAPNLLHFSGHGASTRRWGDTWCWRTIRRLAYPVDAEVLAGLLRGSSVRLAVLNACESARTDPREASRAWRSSWCGRATAVIASDLCAGRSRYAGHRACPVRLRTTGPLMRRSPRGERSFARARRTPGMERSGAYLIAPDGVLWERAPGGARQTANLFWRAWDGLPSVRTSRGPWRSTRSHGGQPVATMSADGPVLTGTQPRAVPRRRIAHEPSLESVRESEWVVFYPGGVS